VLGLLVNKFVQPETGFYFVEEQVSYPDFGRYSPKGKNSNLDLKIVYSG